MITLYIKQHGIEKDPTFSSCDVCLRRSPSYKTSAERKRDAESGFADWLSTITIIHNNRRKEGSGAITQ